MLTKKKLEIFNHYAEIFDNFDFRLNKDDKFTFIDRAKRELGGGNFPDSYIKNLYNSYRTFIINCCFKIHLEKNNKTSQNKVYSFSAPPFVDDIWRLAILYTEKYRELCIKLVGQTIHRDPTLKVKNFKSIFKGFLDDYDKECSRLDNEFTVWVLNKDFEKLAQSILSSILSNEDEGVIKVNVSTYSKRLAEIKKIIERPIYSPSSSKNLSIPRYHKFFDMSKKKR